jgi:ribA/ribD-fused uncharacterized protein
MENNIISYFKNENYFMSNFFEASVSYEGKVYRNAEAAYQAQKDPTRANEFIMLKGDDAKTLGSKVTPRSDWEEIKVQVMYEVVKAKFTQNRNLMQKLMKTGNAELVHGNIHRDTFWGIYGGKGENMLGKILMEIRDEQLAARKREIGQAIDYKDAIADNCFTPNSAEEDRPSTQRQQLRQDAGDKNAVRQEKAELTLADMLKGKKIETGRWAKPEDGEHIVELVGEPDVRNGMHGPYIAFDLRDKKTGVTWKAFINAENLIKTLADISFNNNGFLGGMNAQEAMYNIQQNPFRCWAVADDKGTVRTYFDEEHANRAFYYISKRKAKQEMYELMKKEQEDAKAAQKEAAELTKKAKEENNDLPFDM